jgi:hypothetical protein
MLGEYQEVSCTEWQGAEDTSLWGGSCMAPIDAPLWPSVACGNEGTKHPLISLGCAVMQFWLMYALRVPATSEVGLRRDCKKTADVRRLKTVLTTHGEFLDELLIPCYFSDEASEKLYSYIPNQSRVVRSRVC